MPKNIQNTSEVQKTSQIFSLRSIKSFRPVAGKYQFWPKKSFFKKQENSAVKVILTIWLFFESDYLLEKVGPIQFLSGDGKNIDLVSSKQKKFGARAQREPKKKKKNDLRKCAAIFGINRFVLDHFLLSKCLKNCSKCPQFSGNLKFFDRFFLNVWIFE